MPRVVFPPPSGEQPPDYQAPSSPEEFWERDWRYVRLLTGKLLGEREETEDVAADIFEKLLARNVPGMYKPGTVSVHTKKPVTWRAFLSAQVALYVRGKSEQVARRQWREPLLCDATVGRDEATTWVELFGSHSDDEYPSLASDFVPRVRARLAALPPWEGTSLLDLFEEVLARVREGEKPSLAFLRRRFGLTVAEAEQAMARLREEVSLSAVPVPAVEIAGVTLTPAEAEQAAKLLEESPGSHVRPVFARAGHKLAAGGTKWYLPVAREELRKFPELKKEGGTHATGHVSHVKEALIHWLRRSAAGITEVTVLSPPSQPSPAEELEAALWRLGVVGKEQLEEIERLARAAYGLRRVS